MSIRLLIIGQFFFFILLPDTFSQASDNRLFAHGALSREDTSLKTIYLTFTGGDYSEGAKKVISSLKKKKVKAHFFFTGDYYRNPKNRQHIIKLKKRGHYLGPHSDKHLLYASWENRDSLLISKELFRQDLLDNYKAMESFGIKQSDALFFLPPYEWYNQQISDWTREMGIQLLNFSPGTRSNADYTTPDMGERYVDSEKIFKSILTYEAQTSHGLNGFILLLHIGTHPDRKDKFYDKLPLLIDELKQRGYAFALLSKL